MSSLSREQRGGDSIHCVSPATPAVVDETSAFTSPKEIVHGFRRFPSQPHRRPGAERNREIAEFAPVARRTRDSARFRLEGLEDRCLLSGISGDTEFPVPSGNSTYQIASGPDGNLWFTEWQAGRNKIGMINPTTHAVSEFTPQVPIPALTGSRRVPMGISGSPSRDTDKIGMINPTTHAISEFSPTLRRTSEGNHGGSRRQPLVREPRRHREINPTTHAISHFPLSTPKVGITTGPDGNLWFTEYANGRSG